jgi:ketosteroid isomerase-like protein
LKTCSFLALLLLTVGCQSPTNEQATQISPDLAAARTIIEAKTNRFTQAHVTGDTAYLNNSFTANARVYPPNAPMITGRRAIAAINAEYVGYGIREFRNEITALYGSGDYLINEGTYRMRYGKDNSFETGNYIYIWKKENGDWKIDVNTWMPGSPAKP